MSFVAEAADLTEAWRDKKSNGPPTQLEVRELKAGLEAVLVQARFGSKIGESEPRRTKIWSLVQRGAEAQALTQML